MLKKAVGKIIYGIGKLLSFVFDALIKVIETIVGLVLGVAKGILALLSMGGCLLIMFLLSPFGWVILFNPFVIGTIILVIVIPILGMKFVSLLKYGKYIFTEYLFDLGSYLMDGKGQYKSFNEYGEKYRNIEEEKARKAREERQRQQQREWEERFRQWNEYQRSQQYGGYTGGYQRTGGHTYANPMSEFKTKFEESCRVLGVPNNCDKYQVKLAYRKKAKEWHPDINKSPNATEMFQKINDAYEFLSDENIERYSQMTR